VAAIPAEVGGDWTVGLAETVLLAVEGCLWEELKRGVVGGGGPHAGRGGEYADVVPGPEGPVSLSATEEWV
jgi:hypothetical protein